ncbi:MAG: histidinol-phosphate transaminase, partial [Atribacterota bacterium]|nr:histidinol-phosphate transaminase [Atribacterota bacterium]
NGGDELLYLLTGCFISSGDEVILGEYGFSTYEIASTMYGAKIIKIPLKKGFLDLPTIARQTNAKTKMIFLCNPYNPDGTIFTQQELEKFLENISDKIIIVMDEAYIDFVESKDFPNSINLIKEKNNPIVSLRTFSKIGGIAGLRIGFGIAQPEFVNCLRKVQQPYSVNRLAQTAARACINDNDYRDQLLQNNREGKDYLYKELTALNLFYHQTQTNFIFADTQKDADMVCEKLAEKGIIVRSGKVWGKDTFIRVTIGTETQNKIFIKALTDILQENI